MSYAVLFVDDEPNVLDGFRKAFRKAAFEVYTAASARLALELMADQEVDLLVSDERMPGMSGAELLSRAARAHPQVPRLMLTGHATMDAAVRAVNEGKIERLLTKPVESAELERTIMELLAAHHPEDPELHPDRRTRIMQGLEDRFTGITRVDRDVSGAVILEE